MQIECAAQIFTSGLFHNTDIVRIREVQAGAQFIFSQFNHEGMLVAVTELYRFGEPVSIQSLQRFFAKRVIFLHVIRIIDIIHPLCKFHIQFLQGVAQVITRQIRHVQIQTPCITETRFVGIQPLGFNDHHAVSRFRPVNGFGGGVFQDSQAFHPLHVQIKNRFGRHFKSVQDKQGLVRFVLVIPLQIAVYFPARERCPSTHIHLRQGIRIGPHVQIVHDKDRRVQVFQTLKNIRVTHAFQIIPLDHRGGPRKTFCFTFHDTRHNHLIHFLDIFFQYHFDIRLTGIFHLL